MAVMNSRGMIVCGAAFAGTAVAAGAFGAHLLKPVLDATMLAVFETAVRYQMYHALALCMVACIGGRDPRLRVGAVGWLFATGIALFSGSLYVLSLSGIRWIGALTPLGGAAFMAGWAVLGWTVARSRP
jgi:uncharacterized membrane protein YgdD (TMEM256/DUF423 family)